jgi:hypothetical protein
MAQRLEHHNNDYISHEKARLTGICLRKILCWFICLWLPSVNLGIGMPGVVPLACKLLSVENSPYM